MSGPTRIFVGDLVRALSDLGEPGGKNWQDIAKLLGMTWIETRGVEPQTAKSPAEQVTAQKTRAAVIESSVESTQELPADDDIGQLIDFEFAHTTADAEEIPESGASQPESSAKAMSTIQPLLDPLWERGILVEAVSTPVRQGDIDIIETVAMIARGRSLQDAPRQVIPSVSKGCHVLIDTGVGMQPFTEDTFQLVTAVRRTVGFAHTSVFTFMDCPTTGVLTETYEDSAYMPPENGCVVLALTDLCRAGPIGAVPEADLSDWLLVARRIRVTGSSLVVLNPYPPDRWPSELRRRIPILYWDRSTRTAAVRRIRRTRQN